MKVPPQPFTCGILGLALVSDELERQALHAWKGSTIRTVPGIWFQTACFSVGTYGSDNLDLRPECPGNQATRTGAQASHYRGTCRSIDTQHNRQTTGAHTHVIPPLPVSRCNSKAPKRHFPNHTEWLFNQAGMHVLNVRIYTVLQCAGPILQESCWIGFGLVVLSD